MGLTDSERECPTDAPPMASVLERNIRLMHARFQRESQGRSRQDRLAEAISRFSESMPFVYLHVLLYGAWIILNLGWTRIPPFDSTFVVLAMAASVEAIFLSTFVLITQNRMTALAEKRADLDLHISLLTEHDVTRIIHLLTEIMERLNVAPKFQQELSELKQDVAPEQVLDRLEESVDQEAQNLHKLA